VGSSCSSRNTTFDSLTNEGLIPVSTDNPFIGSNVFLAKEMEDSNYLYSFIKSRGAPQAIELTGSSEKHAELHLYYSGTRELYRATPQFDPQNRSKEWIVKGPYALDRDTYRVLQQLHTEDGGVFEIFGKREVIGGRARASETRVITPAFVPTPTPKPTPVPRRVPNVTKQEPSVTTGPEVGVSGSPSNLDQEALIESLKRKLTTPTGAAAAPTPVEKASEKAKAPPEAAKKAVEPPKTAVQPAPAPAKIATDKPLEKPSKGAPSLSDVEKEGAAKKN
jgi:hypothetical protein